MNKLSEAAHLINQSLSEEERSQFASVVDTLVTDLNNLLATKPRCHPTTNWKKRQRRRPPTSGRSPQAPPPLSTCSRNPVIPGIGAITHSTASQEKQPESEASKIQKWYKANKKQCFRSICSDKNSPRCEIPLKDLEDHFTVTPPSPPPDRYPNTEGNFDSDELSYEVTPEEVKCQLKRLPPQSSPGPDGVPYYVWKSSTLAPELLSAIYNTC